MATQDPRIGELIRRLYLERGYNRRTFAQKIGAAYTTLLGWEHRGVIPTRDKIAIVVDVLRPSTEERQQLMTLVDGSEAWADPTKVEVVDGAREAIDAVRSAQVSAEDAELVDGLMSGAFVPDRHSLAKIAECWHDIEQLAAVLRIYPRQAELARAVLDEVSLRNRVRRSPMVLLGYALAVMEKEAKDDEAHVTPT